MLMLEVVNPCCTIVTEYCLGIHTNSPGCRTRSGEGCIHALSEQEN